MKTISKYLRGALGAIMSIGLTCAITSCDTIFDYEGDCSVTYKMKFRYDHNMKYADAFANEVKSVTLYAFSPDGVLRYVKTESGAALAAEDYCMTLDGLEAGEYNFMAWCGTENSTSYELSEMVHHSSTRDELTCRLSRKYNEAGEAYIDEDLSPALFHGIIEDAIKLPTKEGVHTYTMSLKKNTNNVHIVLQHLSGEPVDVSQFNFFVTDENGHMSHDNSLRPDESITYNAWYTHDGVAEVPEVGARATTSMGVAIADITTGRLVKGNKPRLTVTNNKNEIVLSIPLIDYALLVKGHYREMSDQEYLDRQDEYNMTFFLDERDKWLNTHIYINSWKVVLGDIDF